jgi:hypothetical protein
MDPSALSTAVRRLRSVLTTEVKLPSDQVLIGHPNAAAKEVAPGNGKHFLNLFVYRVDPGAYPADGASRDPLFLRVYCLITAFADSDGGQNGASAGENDLRLIGAAMAALHRRPLLDLADDSGPVAQLQVILSPLTLDDINHIWATQADTPYRLSVAYELALLPLPLGRPLARGPRVGALGLGIGAGAGSPAVAILPFCVERLRVEAAAPDWAPQLAFLTDDRKLPLALAFARDARPASVGVVGVGRPGETAALVWQGWDSATGWVPLGAPTSPPTLTFLAALVDPAESPGPAGVDVALPASAHAQLQLHAERTWLRPDGVAAVVRSNPLLISFYGGAAP